MPTVNLNRYHEALSETPGARREGRVREAVGIALEAEGLDVSIGELCHIHSRRQRSGKPGDEIPAEVVGFRGERFVLVPLTDVRGIGPESRVTATGRSFRVPVGDAMLGRVLDGLGRPIDGRGPLRVQHTYEPAQHPPSPLGRQPISRQIQTGVRAIDTAIACAEGQRMGIFAGSGVGKSTLIGMICRNIEADVRVIALIGERGREVRNFIENDLGPDGLARSVVIVSTSDQPAMLRLKAAWVATSIAEHFRDAGLRTALMMDSVTRLAMAQREIGLAAGEPPTSRGYTPSVFSLLPKVLERAGMGEVGSITAFYTVLVDGDDFTEPITDAVRGILDGHIYLSRELANENHFPAIDVLGSLSRVMRDIVEERHYRLADDLRHVMATYHHARDMIDIGAYSAGSNPKIDRAVRLMGQISAFLQQTPDDLSPVSRSLDRIEGILNAPDNAPLTTLGRPR